MGEGITYWVLPSGGNLNSKSKIEMETLNKSTKVEAEQEAPACGNTWFGAVRFRSHEAHKLNAEFEKHFGVKFQNFWLGWIPGFSNCLLIDLSKFDQYLMEKYNYNGSMSDFVLTEFGQSAHEFLKQLI